MRPCKEKRGIVIKLCHPLSTDPFVVYITPPERLLPPVRLASEAEPKTVKGVVVAKRALKPLGH